MNTVLFCMFTCRPAPFLVIRRGQPKAQPSFLNLKGQPALFIIVGLAAALRVLCRKCRQQLFEIGIVCLYHNDAAILVKTNHGLLIRSSYPYEKAAATIPVTAAASASVSLP